MTEVLPDSHAIDPAALAHLSAEAAGLAVASATNPEERAELAAAVDDELADQGLGIYDKTVHTGPLSLEALIEAAKEERAQDLLNEGIVSPRLPSYDRQKLARWAVGKILYMSPQERQALLELARRMQGKHLVKADIPDVQDNVDPSVIEDRLLAKLLISRRRKSIAS